MKIWRQFFEKAKGNRVVLIIPGVYNESAPLWLDPDNWEVTDEMLIYKDGDDEVWCRLDAIMWGRITPPEQE